MTEARLSPLLSRIAKQISPIAFTDPLTARRGVTNITKLEEKGKAEMKRAIMQKDAFVQTPAWNMIVEIFGDEVNGLHFPEDDKDSPEAMNILRSFYKYTLDGGLNRKIDIGNLHAEPHIMFNRTTFINEVTKKMKQGEQTLPTLFGMIDIADVRSSDFIIESHRNTPADLLVNTAARTLDDVLKKLWEEKGWAHDRTKQYVTGRYGGDEFVFSLIGDFSPNLQGEINEKLLIALHAEKQYIKDTDGNIISKPIGLKLEDGKEQIEWIDALSNPDTSQEDKQLFIHNFKHGLVLGKGELKKIKGKHAEVITEEEEGNKYPPEVDSVEKKVAYLAKTHPEMSVALYLAEHFDLVEQNKKLESPPIFRRREAIINLIENYVYDKLLEDAVYSKFDLLEHARRGEFKQFAVIDFKFIKELNELASYADADQAIRGLWDNLKKAISSKRDAYMVARAGGTYIIGIREQGKGILNEKQLKELSELKIQVGDAQMSLPVGYKIGRSIHNLNENKALEECGRVITEASNDAVGGIVNLAERIHKNNPTLLTDSDHKIDESKLTENDLVWKFFHGKRKIERCNTALEILKDKSTSITSVFNQILTS
ncbi:hypothetical protein HZC27_00265 [Candidatus Roizmanbacteria bacterium]|nr:hypothetical protein [Candidatus Roizmanbacteria bacterium]